MLQVSLFRHASELSDSTVVTKKVRIDDHRSILFQIDAKKSHMASLLEGAIVDAVADSGKASDTATYFSFVLDRLNRHLRAVAPDLDTTIARVFLSAIDESEIHFSVLGNYRVYLVRGGKVTDIAEGMSGDTEFSYVSSGEVTFPDSLYVANVDLLDYLTEDDVAELSSAGKDEEKRLAIENLIRREAENRAIDCIVLSNSGTEISETVGIKRSIHSGDITPLDQATDMAKVLIEKTLPFVKTATLKGFQKVSERASEIPMIRENFEKIRNLSFWKNERFRAGLFAIGILVSAFLLYAAISAIFQQKSDSAVPEEYKNRLIEAQLILEKAGKDLANKEVFKENLAKAENLIFEVRGKGVYLNDVKRLLDTISILKKQMNGVESFDPKAHEAEYVFANSSFHPIGVFEVSKKYYFIGKTQLAGPFIQGAEMKTYSYPDAEEAVSVDATAEGIIYILTKTNRVLKFYKGEFSYTNVEGQKTWEAGRSVKTFNSNLYIVSEDGNQVYKHKPGVNGFSAKSSILEGDRSKKSTILDIALDGGIYLLKKDLSLDKVFTVPDYSERSVMINGLPDGYAFTADSNPPKILVPGNANYLYMVLENRIWIFEPDSRNYKDVKSVRYVGQIEVTEDVVRAIAVPKDGTVIAATKNGVYQIRFEVSDGKIVIR